MAAIGRVKSLNKTTYYTITKYVSFAICTYIKKVSIRNNQNTTIILIFTLPSKILKGETITNITYIDRPSFLFSAGIFIMVHHWSDGLC